MNPLLVSIVFFAFVVLNVLATLLVIRGASWHK
jgi:hypothetical protein